MKSINRERYDPTVFWVESIGKLSTILFIDNQDIVFSNTDDDVDDYFFQFPNKHLGRIVNVLCFSLVNDSSVRFI